MENSTEVLPSNDAGDDDASTSTSALSLLSIDAIKYSATAPSLNDCDGKPQSNYARDDDAIKGSTAAPSLTDYDDDEDICRICRNPGDTENPLRFPCACRGSIKYVHQDCLLQWLNHSNARQCEVCKHDFAFSPVYAENAPTRLSFQEFIVAIAKKTSPIIQIFLRLSFVLSVWLLILPYTIYLIYRLAFVRSFGEVQRLFLSRISMKNILTDCLLGFLVSVSLTCIYHVAPLLRNFFRNLLEQLRGRDFPGNRNLNGDENVQGITRIDKMLDVTDDELVGMQGPDGHLAEDQLIQIAQMIQRIEEMLDELNDNRVEDNQINQRIAHCQAQAREMIQGMKQILEIFTEFADNVEINDLVVKMGPNLQRIAHYQAQLMQLIAQRDARIQAQIRLNGAQNVPLSELLGLQGQLCPIAVFAFTVLVRNIYALGGVIFVPFCLGRVILHYMFSKESSNLATLRVGYMVIISLLFLYLVILELIHYKRGEPLIIGGFNLHYLASVRETIPSLLRHLKTMLKFTFIVVIYLVVLPLICGWWIYICTKVMFGELIPQRLDFFTILTFVHWAIGLLYLLQTTMFIIRLKEVLFNEVPPNYNQFCDLIAVPVHKHVLRFLLSCAISGILIVMVIFLPVKLAMWISPFVFPLKITVSNPSAEIPLFQNFFNFVFRDVVFGRRMKSVIHYWLTIVGSALGLTDFLLDNRAHQRQDRDFVVLSILAWTTLLVSNTALIILPVSLGRLFLIAISHFPIINGLKFSDFSAFIIGVYVIWGLVALIWGIVDEIEQIRMIRVNVSWMDIRKWGVIVLMICVLVCLLILGFSIVINSVVFQFALSGCLGLCLVWYCVKGFRVWFTYLHNSIRDERYLIGRTLRNFGEDKEV